MAHPYPDDWDFYDLFIALAKQYRHRFSFIMSPPLGDASTLVCYNNVDDIRYTASDLTTVDGFENFIKRCAEPLIPELTERSQAQYTSVSHRKTGLNGCTSPDVVWPTYGT
jgi:hypothetical protein